MESEDEILLGVSNLPVAEQLFAAFKLASGNKQMRESSYVDYTGVTLAVDSDFNVRLVPLKELQ